LTPFWIIVQVEQKVNKMQRQYFLQEQLKIIKRELGLEVRRRCSSGVHELVTLVVHSSTLER